MKKLLAILILLYPALAWGQTSPDQRPHAGQVCQVNKVNNFLQNQNVTGTVAATLFSGSGASLTTLNATNLSSGTVASARGGAGSISGALKGNGAGVVTQAACADISDSSTGCSTTVGSLATLNTINNGNWSGTALAIGNGGTGQASATNAFNALSPMTTSGDIIYGGTSGAGTRLGANSTATNKYLQSVSSGTPSWQQIAFTDISGTATAAQEPTITRATQTAAWQTFGGGL